MTPTIRQIRAAVAEYYDITEADITGKSRQVVFAHPRMIGYYICSTHLDASSGAIGYAFGNRDHTTILSGIRSVETRMTPETRAAIKEIIALATTAAEFTAGGVFRSQRGENPLFVSTRNTKEST